MPLRGGGYNFRWYHQTFVPFGEYVLGRYMILAWKEEGSRSSRQPPKYGIVLKWLYLKTNETEMFNCSFLKLQNTVILKYLQHQLFFMLSASYHKGRVRLPNRMNFQKNSKRTSTPSPYFRKIMLQHFYDRYGCIYAWRYDGQIVWNTCTWFFRDRDHSEGWGVNCSLEPFWKFIWFGSVTHP